MPEKLALNGIWRLLVNPIPQQSPESCYRSPKCELSSSLGDKPHRKKDAGGQDLS